MSKTNWAEVMLTAKPLTPQDQDLILTILDNVAIHISRSIFDNLLAELIDIGAIDPEAAEPALELYDKAVEGEDM